LIGIRGLAVSASTHDFGASMRNAAALAAVATAALLAVGTAVTTADASVASRWTNCTALHRIWPHGVGRLHTHDHTSGVPVTNFRHSNRLYHRAMLHNSGLDRDKDHIACEAH
jgi:hypothetical protein